MMKIFPFFTILILSQGWFSSLSTADPRVEIPGLGAVFGETYHYVRNEYPTIDTYVDIFRGIPFAKPPLGELRFAKPVAAEPFAEDYNATYFRRACNQLGSETSNIGDEDCLHLNIWTPNPRISNAAVMVWIHGGGFIIGDAVDVKHDGIPLVGFNEIVFVSIQYRLNSFGFLTTGDSVLPGNYGMWDQQMALHWIKQHISAFGGDPDNIMIAGQSAGGAGVALHLLSPHSWPSFNRALLQSGTATSGWAIEYDIENARSDTMSVAKDCGCDTSSSTAILDCLRQVPQTNITAASNKLSIQTVNIPPFIPVIDHDFIKDEPARLVAKGEFKQCDLLLGSTRDEATGFAMRAFPEQITRRDPFIPRSRWDIVVPQWVFSYSNDLIIEAVDQQYIDWTVADDPDSNYFWLWVQMHTDEAFACPTDLFARAWVEKGNNVYLYQFNHVPSSQRGTIPTWLQVSHNVDLEFMFGRGLNPLIEDFTQTPEEVNMTIYMMSTWTNFAKSGNPNSEPIPLANMDTTWPMLTIPELRYKELSPTMPNYEALKTDVCHFWNDFVPKMVSFAADLEEIERQWREEFYSWKHEDMPNWRQAFEDYQDLAKSTCQN